MLICQRQPASPTAGEELTSVLRLYWLIESGLAHTITISAGSLLNMNCTKHPKRMNSEWEMNNKKEIYYIVQVYLLSSQFVA